MGNKIRKIQTLCIVHQHPKVLLGMKKRGFGEGRWNGFGGKLQEGETVEEAARRELFEEASLKVKDIEKVGIVDFEFKGQPEILEVHIFRGSGIEGELEESEEMKPCWFHTNDIPFESMWPDDKHWLPLFLQGKKFKGRFLFGEADSILDMKLEEVKEV